MKKFNLFLLVFLLLGCFVFGEKIVTLTDINAPERIVVDKDRIFIAEMTSIFIYSLDGKLQQKFGKRGEGPTEFIASPNTGGLQIDILPDMIMATSVGKVSFFKRNGEFIRVIKAPRGVASYKPLNDRGDRFVGMGFAADESVLYATINLYDGQLQKEKEIHRQVNPYQPRKKMNPFLTPPLPYVDKGTIVVDTRLGTFLVFNDKGESLATIKPTFEKIKLTKDYQDKVWNYYSTNPRVKHNFHRIKNIIQMPENLPDVKMCSVDDQKIYALTYRRKNDQAEFYVFDFNGKRLKHLFVTFAYRNLLKPFPYTIHKDVLYYIAEDIEKEQWTLYRTEIK
jgi:hypothetical protein